MQISPSTSSTTGSTPPTAASAPVAAASAPRTDDDVATVQREALAQLDGVIGGSAPTLAGIASGAAGLPSFQEVGTASVAGLEGTRDRIDAVLDARKGKLAGASGAEAATQSQQIDLLQMLRDRIQLSIERTMDLLSGVDRPDVWDDDVNSGRVRPPAPHSTSAPAAAVSAPGGPLGGSSTSTKPSDPSGDAGAGDRERQRQEDLALLVQRRSILAGGIGFG